MRYQGSEAYLLEGAENLNEGRGRRLVAHEGGHLDADARSGVSPYAFKLAGVIVALFLALFLVGNLSVTLTADTVALLKSNNETSSLIKEYKAVNDDLRIEYSLLTGSERIARIATQELGMLYANDADRITLT